MPLGTGRGAASRRGSQVLVLLVLVACSPEYSSGEAARRTAAPPTGNAALECTPAVMRVSLNVKVQRHNEWSTGDLFIAGCRKDLTMTSAERKSLSDFFLALAQDASARVRMCEDDGMPDTGITAKANQKVGRTVLSDWCLAFRTDM